ncbi:MAG: DUF3341 domain-containing protein [Deltaproteobacteria bacterium]|nr:DUF3341 domain-containing protein [Deltaproteobacteria bacterium]MBW2413093.1 DUF3341 domain-containing protein [Deltaproteobacteria bacterium]
MASVLGVLKSPAETVGVIHSLRGAGFDDLEVFSPIPSHEIEHAFNPAPSGVRLWTLIGGLTGVTLGYLMTIWMSYDWELVIAGKPFASIPAYTVIAFELTILFGGALTVGALLVYGLLLPKQKSRGYRPSFSVGDFGCVVECQADQIPRVQELLESAGCSEVRVVEG